MSGILSGNIESLGELDPGLAEALSKARGDLDVRPSKSGLPTAFLAGAALHSTYSPEAEASRRIANEGIEGSSAAIFLGAGLGYEAIEARRRRPGILVVLSFDSIGSARSLLETTDLSPILDGPTAFLVKGIHDPLERAEDLLDDFSSAAVAFIEKRPFLERDPAWYRSVVESFRTIAGMRNVGMRAIASFGRNWMMNYIRNIGRIASSPDLSALEGFARGRAVAVVGAGPSLDSAILGLEPRGDIPLPIIASDTALKPLLAGNITPAFVMAADSQDSTLAHFEGVPLDDLNLIAAPILPPSLVSRPFGGIFFFGLEDPSFRFLEERSRPLPRLKAGGSVVTTAIKAASLMQAETIILIGCDFAYKRGRTHASGTSYEETALASLGRFSTMEGAESRRMRKDDEIRIERGGREIITGRNLLHYASWIEAEAGRMGAGLLQVLPSGMLEGIDEISLREASKLLSSECVVPRAKAVAERPDEERIIADLVAKALTLKVRMETAIEAGDAGTIAGILGEASRGPLNLLVRPSAVAARTASEEEVLEIASVETIPILDSFIDEVES